MHGSLPKFSKLAPSGPFGSFSSKRLFVSLYTNFPQP